MWIRQGDRVTNLETGNVFVVVNDQEDREKKTWHVVSVIPTNTNRNVVITKHTTKDDAVGSMEKMLKAFNIKPYEPKEEN